MKNFLNAVKDMSITQRHDFPRSVRDLILTEYKLTFKTDKKYEENIKK